MHTKSRLLITLILGLSSLQGCATMEQGKAGETQPAEKAQVAEISLQSSSGVRTAEKVAAPVVATMTEQPVAKAIPKQPAAPLDRYTVVAGDTLALIASRQEIYGDAKLWPLLYVANNNQIGPRGLIFPGQVLGINRNFTAADVRALTGRSPSVASRAAVSAKPVVVQKTIAAAAPVKEATVKAAPVKPVEVETKAQAAAVTIVKEEAKPVVAEAKPQEAVAAKPKVAVKPGDYLGAARRAFAAGDIPWAIHYYTAYLDVQKRDANAWGELGNVYYFDGMLPESAQAYFNAANVLIDRGQTARAMTLMPALEEGNPGLAEAIYLRLTTVKR